MHRKTIIAGIITALTYSCSYAADENFRMDSCGTLQANGQLGQAGPNTLDRLITDFISDTVLTPALSVAVVKNDKVIYARGFGFSNLENCTRAATDTRYYLKSVTKSFLGMAAALLHEQGDIMLDEPISAYLPDLRTPEGINPKHISLRAHITHTQPYFDAGLNYRTAYPGNLPESGFITHVNEFAQTADINFRYSNFGPIMTAHAIGEKTRVNWRDLITDKIFSPAGMQNSFTSIALAEQGPMATAYLSDKDGRFIVTQTKHDSQMHAAGGSVSTVEDLARWIILNLNQGRIDGSQVFPKRAVEHAHARQVYLDWDFLEIHRFAHGLGVYSADYDDDLLMHHFGGESHLSFMPEHKLGIAVLSNAISDGSRVTHNLALTLYDQLLSKPDLDSRIERRLTKTRQDIAEFEKRKTAYLRDLQENTPENNPQYSYTQLTGHYLDNRLGEMIITVNDQNQLQLQFGALSSQLMHLGADSYRMDIDPWGGMPPQAITFRKNENGTLVLDWGGRIFAHQP